MEVEHFTKPTSDVAFVSLGMVVLDELRFPGKEPIRNVIGGSGAYSTLGARLFAGSLRSASIGSIVMAGEDFPQEAEDSLRDWDVNMVMRRDPETLSTRGLLVYEDTTFGPKSFEYTTSPLKPLPTDLSPTTFLSSRAFHFLARPEEVIEQVPSLLGLRARSGIQDKPLIIWEPLPAACKPENLELFLSAYKHVDVFSPNHIEMTRLFTEDIPDKLQRVALESYVERFSDCSTTRCVVIRAGEHGALFPSHKGGFHWLPAFYPPEGDTSKIIDPTGAGNAFLGGFAIGMQKDGDLADAVVYGNVAASFALEQIGLPQRTSSGLLESWNGRSVESRLAEYRSRGGIGTVGGVKLEAP